MKLNRFYPIFDTSGAVKTAVELGVKFLQLRIKDSSEKEIRSEIIKAKSFCEWHGAELVVNDYWEIAIDEKCNFIHLGQEDLDKADLNAIKMSGLRIGVSTHDKTELARALKVNPDYIALGPIFPTVLKEMKWSPQGLSRISDWKKKVKNIPLVAIGGFNFERARKAYNYGADSVSVVTDISLSKTPEKKIKEWIRFTK